MVSQPLVAGGLAGLVVGNPGAGLLAGLLLQVVWGRSLPIGAASLPFAGPAAVVAGALAGVSGRGAQPLGNLELPEAVALGVALAAAVLVGEAGRLGVEWIGRHRRGVIRRADAAAARGDPGGVMRANLLGSIPTALWGAVLVAAGLGAGAGALGLAADLPRADGRWLAAVLGGLGIGRTVSLRLTGVRGWGWVAGTGVLVLLLGGLR